MRRCSIFISVFVLTVLLFSCRGSDESGLRGELQFEDVPLAGASVEIYLKAEKDRSTLPFATTSTDSEGHYRISLPAGSYFIIGKKKIIEGGRTRMLMAECPANPVEVKDSLLSVAPFPLREMGRDGGLVPEPQTGVKGRLVYADQPVDSGFVYVYTARESGLIGPSYGEAVQSDDSGNFRIELPSGRFFLAARKRADGEQMGEPEADDLNGSFAGNPVEVVSGQYVELGDLALTRVDATEKEKRLAAGKFEKTTTRFEGKVVNRDGEPISGIYVFAYLDSRMVGKPTFISAPTGDDGQYRLNLTDGGTYFLGARSTFGGPLEPGEWVGTYDVAADHSVAIETGKAVDLADIIVREVW